MIHGHHRCFPTSSVETRCLGTAGNVNPGPFHGPIVQQRQTPPSLIDASSKPEPTIVNANIKDTESGTKAGTDSKGGWEISTDDFRKASKDKYEDWRDSGEGDRQHCVCGGEV